MPSSSIDLVPSIVRLLKQNKPSSILDFGIGFGKYGFLAREYLDVPKMTGGFEGSLADNFTTKIDGLEIYEKYISIIQRAVYNHIYIGNGIELLENLSEYEVILILDVIEHFAKEQGLQLLKKAYNKAGRMLIISTPVVTYEQGSFHTNENERHLSSWTREDFKEYPGALFRRFGSILLIILPKNISLIRIPSLREDYPLELLLAESRELAGELYRSFKAKIKSLVVK